MPDIQVHQRCIKQQAVQQVEHAADTGKKTPGVFDTRLALEKRLDQITHYGGGTQDNPQDNCVEVSQALKVLPPKSHEQNAQQRRSDIASIVWQVRGTQSKQVVRTTLKEISTETTQVIGTDTKGH